MTEEMTSFWEDSFHKIFPDRLDGRGLSVVKQLLAGQMLNCILVDVETASDCALLIKFIVKNLQRGY